MATKFEPELGEGPPPTPPEDRDVEPPKAAEKRRAAERRRQAERAPGEVPPPPITEKFPGEAPPYPAGYTPPEGKTVEVDAKGRPTVIETSAGLRQYTPNSTMFKMGYVTSDQYIKSAAARGDKPVPADTFLPITSEKGEALMIDKEVAFALQSRKPREQFRAMQEMGIIESGSQFITAKDGEWSFVSKRELSRVGGIERQIEFEKKKQKQIDRTVSKLEEQWVNAAYAEIDRQLKSESEIVKTWAREDAQYAVDVLKYKYDEALVAPMKERAALFSDIWQGLTPWKEEEGEKATPGGAVLMAAELVVPGVYLKNRWGDLSTGERAAFIAIDIISIVPIIAALSRGAKTVGVAGRVARLSAGAKEAGREAALLVTAPIDMLIHPAGTIKTAAKEVRTLAENMFHPRKLPEAILTTSEGTVRLKVTEVTTPEQARAIRDQLMDLAMKGERPIIEIGGARVELARSPLIRELKGGAAHATPTGEVFEGGLVVSKKVGMPASEQGLFLSHEPLPRFAEASAFGKTGDKPAIVIFSREVAEKSVPTGKIYDSPFGAVAEMERKFPVGFEVPGVEQKLFTRIGPTGQRVEIYLGKPLSARQIAKLKLEGLVETFKAPFKPAINVRNFDQGIGGLIPSQADDLVKVLRASGNIDEARNLERAIRLSRSMRSAAPTTPRVLGRFQRARKRAARERPDRRRIERERPERERPERERAERERAERERAERERPERERPERERPERERPERERPERERLERERIRITDDNGRIRFPRGGSDKEKRKTIKASSGAIAWRQGELHGKDVWHVLMHPYESESDYVTVLGRKPSNTTSVKGPGSAYETIKLRYGKPPSRKVTGDIGFMDFFLEPKGAKKVGIGFTPDPKQETIGDISITRRPPRLSGGRARITPKTPRLKR